MKSKEMTGVFGAWTVLNKVPTQPGDLWTSWLCRCKCGTVRAVQGRNLRAGKSTNCGCLKQDQSYRELQAAVHRKKPFEALYNVLKGSAEERGIPLSLAYEELVDFTKRTVCHYCGSLIQWSAYTTGNGSTSREHQRSTNLDRKDSSLGYSKENCVVCCGTCNRMKSNNFSYEEFLIISHGLRLVQYLRNPVPKDQMNFMHTFSGKMFRYLKPEPEDVCIEDIAHGLSQLNRFVGQTTKPYSVAQHSVLVSQTCPKEFALYGLLHDASEAYTNDVCRVLKLSPGMGIYKWYENLAMSAVCKKFDLPEKEPVEVKTADLVLLLTEKRDLFKNTCLWAMNKYDGTSHLEPLKKKIRPWTAEEAEEKFLDRFTQLKT